MYLQLFLQPLHLGLERCNVLIVVHRDRFLGGGGRGGDRQLEGLVQTLMKVLLLERGLFPFFHLFGFRIFPLGFQLDTKSHHH